MTETRNASDRFRPALVVVATLGTIGLNGLATAGLVNGITPQAVSSRHPTILTPADYAFSIWSLISMGLLAFSVYQVLPKNLERFRNVRSVYILSCVLNCAWIFYWNREQIGICLVIILMLLGALAFISLRLKNTDSMADYWLAKAPFGLYAGWVTAASVVNLMVFLAAMDVETSTSAGVGVVLVILATILGIAGRVILGSYLFPLAIAWALTAIAINQGGHTAVVVAAAVGVNACLIAALSFVVNLPSRDTPATINERR
jgi:hypothetical protein